MKQTLSDRQCDFTNALALTICKAVSLGFKVKVQEWNRLLETQKEYVAKGVSWTMDSRHLDLLAADLILFKDGFPVANKESYRPLGVYWESLGGRWGGRFGLENESKEVQDSKMGKDPYHFEFRRPS